MHVLVPVVPVHVLVGEGKYRREKSEESIGV